MSHTFLYMIISLLASSVGAICGIGGGIIIKPALDFFRLGDASVISFLSSCTVLSMSLYSVSRSFLSKTYTINLSTGIPLTIGAVLGGIIGKTIFNSIKKTVGNVNLVGGIQAICLAIVTLLTLLYTLKKSSIKTKQLKGSGICTAVGCALGVLSSFLGIGGGPINLVVLGYCFSMPTKTAAINSLFIILFSQISTLFTTVISGTVPPFDYKILCLMILGGLVGGIIGRKINKIVKPETVDFLLLIMMMIIVLMNIFNAVRYFY